MGLSMFSSQDKTETRQERVPDQDQDWDSSITVTGYNLNTYTTVQKFGVTQTISCFPWKLTLLFIKWVAKWIENIVKTLTRLQIMIFIWNNNFVLKKFSICSNYSLADLWHSSYQFFEVIWRNFTPRFLKHLPQVGLVWWAHLTYGQAAPTTAQ